MNYKSKFPSLNPAPLSGIKKIRERLGIAEYKLELPPTEPSYREGRGKELEGGIDIESLDEIEGVGDEKYLSKDGYQAILYIKDTMQLYRDIDKRFHVTFCKTLVHMKAEKRFGRYRVTTNATGDFKVDCLDKAKYAQGDALTKRLKVCQNCLEQLGILRLWHFNRSAAVENFDIEKFFQEHGENFFYHQLPPQSAEDEPTTRYTRIYRKNGTLRKEQCNYECQGYRMARDYPELGDCRVNLREHKSLLHSHHKDFNKMNNALTNLIPLCVDCHSKIHGRDLSIRPDERKLTLRIKRKQGF